jgi:hypothetical protein
VADIKYTIVQHSAFGYKGDRQFERGVESRQVDIKVQQDRVIKAGGVLFDTYSEAEDFAMKAMYPEGYPGLTPRVEGTFSDKQVDGLRIYIPVRKVVG